MSQNEIGMSVRQRVPYEPIVNRAPFKLPGNARVAVWTIVNVENWQPTGPMPRTVLPPPMGQPLLPDVPNWAWHEYGMRVGFWRSPAHHDDTSGSDRWRWRWCSGLRASNTTRSTRASSRSLAVSPWLTITRAARRISPS